MQAVAVVANKIENPKTDAKKIDKNISNIDFLEMLLKNANTKDGKVDIKDIKVNITTKDEKKDIKELQDLLKELLLENKTPQNINKEITNIINQLNIDKNIVKEVKNIITSNLKQQNILLNKIEINNLKKINNVKDLLKFANKKGLNIEKITFQIAKDIKQNPKLQKIIIKDIKTPKKIELPKLQTTAQILSTKKNIKVKSDFNNKKISLTETIVKDVKINNSKDNKVVSKQINFNEKIEITNKKEVSSQQNIISQNKLSPQKENIKNIDEKSVNIHKPRINLSKEKIDKNIKPTKITLDSLLQNDKGDKNNIKDNKTITETHKETNINLQTQNVNVNEIKAKQVIAKDTINHFKNNLDEAIKNYKPPISKVNIELNPKHLGKVEVSIIQRGNNITLHMNTDQSNIALFQNHQAEFRQALTNIGFSNIDMSFNSNQEKERKQNQAKKSYKENSDDVEISDIEIEAKYKYA